jgi:hypothetical protein
MQQNQQQAPQAQPQSQPMSQPMANGGATGFEAQETMQGDGVGQPQETPETPPQATEAPVMEDGGVVNNDGLDWGLVFTFFNFRDE